MPRVNKFCIRCRYPIARGRREINCLCGRCIREVNESFKYSLARQRKEQDRAEE